MPDLADEASAVENVFLQEALSRINHDDLDPGVQGDCDLCGEWSGRLIRGICAPCRDKRHLP